MFKPIHFLIVVIDWPAEAVQNKLDKCRWPAWSVFILKSYDFDLQWSWWNEVMIMQFFNTLKLKL